MKYFLIVFITLSIAHGACSQTQTTKQLTLANGDGWYRVIQQNSHRANGMVRIWGTSGNNKSTNLTMFISIMAYGQGGSINIVDNLYYNSNHIAEIRAGSSNGYYVLDIKFENINNPTTVNIQVDGPNLTILDIPVFGSLDIPVGLISISGKVIGINSTRWPIYFDQKIGIGTTSIPSGYKLAVDGKIIAEEIRVEVVNPPDYVFEESYELSNLSDLEGYIESQKHLPEIPSASEMTKNGVDLGDMNMRLLKKIEELTLYLIEQNKQNQEQQTRIEKLEVQNTELLERIAN